MKKNKIFAATLLLLLLIGKCANTEIPQETSKNQAPCITQIEQNDTTQVPNASGNIPAASGNSDGETSVSEPTQQEQTSFAPSVTTDDSTFEIHFIDVGQGDAILVLCDGKAMLIDGGEASESSKIYSYLKNNGIDYLDYIVATHAHSDHVGGLSGALNYATVGTALCPVTSYDSKAFNSFVKYLNNQDIAITVPSAGDSFVLGSAHFQILGPLKNYDDPNDTSIVMKMVYGATSFLFTGDAERTAEADILDAGYNLSATVLKVGHHGSDTSTSYPFLREIMPEYAVIQVGKDNSYGHPTEDTLSRLRDADAKVYRNDLQGTIICSSDGMQVFFRAEKNESIQTNPTVATSSKEDSNVSPDIEEYIGNKNSKKFHLPSCKNLPAEKNRILFASRDKAVQQGYDPCGNCDP